MVTELKTETLDSSPGADDPSIVLCEGHVTPKIFNQAFQNEGWVDPGNYTKNDLKHYYGKRVCGGSWEWRTEVTDGYRPITITTWD